MDLQECLYAMGKDVRKVTRKEKIDFLRDNIKGVGEAKAEKIADVFASYDNVLDIPRNPQTHFALQQAIGQSSDF